MRNRRVFNQDLRRAVPAAVVALLLLPANARAAKPTPTPPPPQYHAVELVAPGGAFFVNHDPYSSPPTHRLSDDGVFAGNISRSGSGWSCTWQAATYDTGNTTTLGSVPGVLLEPLGDRPSWARAISTSRTFILGGTASIGPADPCPQGGGWTPTMWYRYDAATWRPDGAMETCSALSARPNTFFEDVSESGLATGACTGGGYDAQPVIWRRGGTTGPSPWAIAALPLADTAGASYISGIGYAVNSRGMVAGWVNDASVVSHAAVWRCDVDLGCPLVVLDGTNLTEASPRDIDEDGDLFGRCSAGLCFWRYQPGSDSWGTVEVVEPSGGNPGGSSNRTRAGLVAAAWTAAGATRYLWDSGTGGWPGRLLDDLDDGPAGLTFEASTYSATSMNSPGAIHVLGRYCVRRNQCRDWKGLVVPFLQ